MRYAGRIPFILVVAGACCLFHARAGADSASDKLHKALADLKKATHKTEPEQKPTPVSDPKNPTAAAGPQAVERPTSSKASPDVLGVKLGKSSVEDARLALGRVNPTLLLDERTAKLVGQSSTGRALMRPVDIPNTKYVSEFYGITPSYKGTNCNVPEIVRFPEKGNCETVIVEFSAPPNNATALSVQRTILFAHRPPTESVTHSLVEKYGEPGFHTSYGDRGADQHYVWAWSADGNLMPLSALHLCVVSGASTGLGHRREESDALLHAGCAAMLTVDVNQENSTVASMTTVAIDEFGIYSSQVKTDEFVAAGVKAIEEKEREKAKAVDAPAL